MGAFWDERARENAAFFVDNRLDYRDPDLDAFWAGGVEVVEDYLDRLGFEIAADSRIAEIGCGLGRITRVLAARAASVVALDVSQEMLEQAREHNPSLRNVEWMHGDGSSLAGIEDASVDGVFSHVVFQHVPAPEITYAYVTEMGRVLRPGGWSAFQVSDQAELHAQRTGVAARVAALFGRAPKGVEHPAWRGSAVALDVLRARADAAQLDVERVVGQGSQFCLVLLRRRST